MQHAQNVPLRSGVTASTWSIVVALGGIGGGGPDASAGDVFLLERVISTAADGANSVFAADVDGDGDTDVLSSSQVDDKIAWYENDGGSPPGFTERVISTAADSARSVFAADVDGDGDTDVLSASEFDDTIAWYENDGGSPPGFTERVISTAANGAQSVFAADVDGDGDTDVLSASVFDAKIAWYENDGGSPPGFTERVISTAALRAESVFAADVDGDGDMDVLSASATDDTIAWYENDGGSPPGFTERVISTTADFALSVFAADVDGDGDTDVLSASRNDDTIAWYDNDGGSPPGFREIVISTTANDAYSVFAADVDGDGDTDVLSASALDHKIAWYDSDGGSRPGFTERVISNTALQARSVFAADVDGDGDTDVLSASLGDDTIAWYENVPFVINLSTGTFFPTIEQAITAARDGDTLLADAELFPLEPTIDFQGKALTLRSRAEIFQPEGGLYDLADGVALESAVGFDIDLDGDLVAPVAADADVAGDFLSVGGSGSITAEIGVRLVVNSGALLDGDVTLESGATAVFGGDVTFRPFIRSSTERVISTAADDARSVFAADVDGDGDTDVLSASEVDDTIAWYESDGGSPPGFTERVISTTANAARSVFAADVDGDGDTDVLSASRDDDTIAWYESDGGSPPAFTERVISTAADAALSVFAADVDGDGDTDVLSASRNDNKIAWYESDGGSPPGFTERVISTTASFAFSVFAADVDGDGDTDVLSASQNDDTIAWYENDGGSPPGFTERVISTAADGAQSVFAADVDGDGDMDVLSASATDLKIAWYESDGGSPPGFTERVISTAADGALSVFAADVDGDGDTDVLSASRLDDKIAWYESDGGSPPAFTERVISTAADNAQSVFAADVDGDGDTDVLSASRDDDKIAWYESDATRTSLASNSLLAADGDLEIRRATGVTGGQLAAGGSVLNTGLLRLFDGGVEAGAGLTNMDAMEGFGNLAADVANDGDATFVADTQVEGDYHNTGTTTIQNGTLTILGTLTNDGVIIGDVSSGVAGPFDPDRRDPGSGGGDPLPLESGDGLFVRGAFTAGPQASLLMASEEAVLRAGAAYDVAIDDNTRYHMARAELRMVAIGGQTLEVMSLDRGAVDAGLDRDLPGSFPIRKLRLGPTSTTVVLADAHDNAGDGQTECEAVYVESLLIDEGATLITNGCRVYYVTAQIDGAIDEPANVIQIGDCPDLDGSGAADFGDILAILAAWGQAGGPEDLDGSGTVDFGDILRVLDAWGPCE